MKRRVQVDGAAVTIAVGAEGDETSSGHGCVVQTMKHNVVLRMDDTSLRVVDAHGFCGGSIHVRHELELPQNLMFARRTSGGRYGVAWDSNNNNGEGLPRIVYVVDFQTGEVNAQPLPTLNEQIGDAFVDASGQQIVVVGRATGKLYTWNQCAVDVSDVLETRGLSEWRFVDDTAVDTQLANACSCGRFISSPVMGNCFTYLRAQQRLNGSVVVEKWVFDVDAGWIPVSFSSRQLGASAVDSEHTLKLFMTDTWKDAMVMVGSVLYHFQVGQELRNSVVKRLPLDHQVLGGAWIEQDTAFAVLLANGQMSIVHTDARFEILSISTSSTMSKRLSLSALLGKAVPAALQLVWIPNERQVLVDFGTSCVAFKLQVFNDNPPASLASESPLNIPSSRLFGPGRKRMMPNLVKNSSDFGDCVREILEAKSSPSSNELLDVARIALTRSRVIFEDLYFILLCIIHQQLIDDKINIGKSRDPIDCIGRSLKVMEMLVTLTISVDATLTRQVSQRILSALPGCATKSDRKLYYHKEIAAISRGLQQKLSGTSESVDHWAYSAEVTSFLRVYFTPVRALLQELHADPRRSLADVHLIYQRVMEREEMPAIAEMLNEADRSSGSPSDRLKLLLLSYMLTCCCLQVNGVMIDMEHYFSIALDPSTLQRKETLCCFLKPFRLDDPERSASWSGKVDAATKCAVKANALQLMLKFSMASKSPLAHCFIQSLCKSGEVSLESAELKVNCLHWQACEAYIGEAVAILQRMGAQRRFRRTNREADCSTGRHSLSTLIAQDFQVYHETIPSKHARSTESVGTIKTALGEFSQLEEPLLARVVCLVSRIVWHLEAASECFNSLFEQAFALNCVNDPSTEDGSLWNCITRARVVFNHAETELRFPRFQQPDNSLRSEPHRPQKIVRSLVLIVWALWVREKVSYCSRSLHLAAKENPDSVSDKEDLGALAATCSLQLNTLGDIFGVNEDLLNIQLSLLEEAVTMNPRKVAEVIAWGFPVYRISTRHLKRYKSLRRLLEQQPTGISLEDFTNQFQNIQEHIKRAFNVDFDKLYPHEALKPSDDSDLNILIDCCCDSEILQIIAVMTKSPFEPVIDRPAESIQVDLHDCNPHVSEFVEVPAVNIEISHPTNASAESDEAEKAEELQLSENQISRDEVIALLKAQTRHLEERIQAVTAATTLEKKEQSRPPSSHEDVQEPQQPPRPSSKPDHHNKAPTSVDTVDDDKALVDLADVQRMARISLQVRDLRRHRYSSASSDVDVQNAQPAMPAKRHDSVRNALKLFRLRQGNCGFPQSDLEDSGFVSEEPSLLSLSKSKCEKRAPAAISSKRDKLKRTGVKLKPTRNQRNAPSERFPPKEPVYPLRLEYGTDRANLKLLGRNSQQRNPSVKRRQFVHQDRGRMQHASYPAKPRAAVSLSETDAIQLKTVSAQTNDQLNTATLLAPAAEEVKELSTQQENIPEKSSPVSQEFLKDRPVPRRSVSGIGTQCDVNDDRRANEGRRARGYLPLSIADNFPIWVDLGGADNVGARQHFKERRKFLQVVRFGDQDTKDHTANNETAEDLELFTTGPSVPTIIESRKVHSEPGSDENQSDGQPSPNLGSTQAYDDHTAEQTEDAVKARYRASYRQRYPTGDRPSRLSEDRDATSGIDSLIDLRNNMQQMTQRLRVLETCANSIDEEFKVSQKRLSRIGERRPDGVSSKTQVLEDVNEALELTEDIGSQAGSRNPRGGLLSKKASRDLDAAKKLLETIEQRSIISTDRKYINIFRTDRKSN